MLVNMPLNNDPVKILENSPFTFYLTGSRFFGTNMPYSDWDFFTEDAEDIEDYLLQHKFRNIAVQDTDYFGTTGIVKIFRFGNVDVHLVKNAKMKNIVQTRLKEMISNTNKKERKQLWTIALTIAEALVSTQ